MVFGLAGSTLARPRPIERELLACFIIFWKGIVAAGVEDDETQLLGRLHRDQQPVEREGFVVDVGIALEPGIDRNQVIGAVDLHAVAGIIDDGDIGIARLVGKVPQRPPHLERGQIVARHHDVEFGVLEHRRDGGGIPDRVAQRRDVLVGGVADHQRDALFGKGADMGLRQENQTQYRRSNDLHGRNPLAETIERGSAVGLLNRATRSRRRQVTLRGGRSQL